MSAPTSAVQRWILESQRELLRRSETPAPVEGPLAPTASSSPGN